MDSPEKYKNKLADQEKTIEDLENQLKITSDNLRKASHSYSKSGAEKGENSMELELRQINQEYQSQIQFLQVSLAKNNKKLENYLKTIECLEKQQKNYNSIINNLEKSNGSLIDQLREADNKMISLMEIANNHRSREKESEIMHFHEQQFDPCVCNDFSKVKSRDSIKNLSTKLSTTKAGYGTKEYGKQFNDIVKEIIEPVVKNSFENSDHSISEYKNTFSLSKEMTNNEFSLEEVTKILKFCKHIGNLLKSSNLDSILSKLISQNDYFEKNQDYIALIPILGDFVKKLISNVQINFEFYYSKLAVILNSFSILNEKFKLFTDSLHDKPIIENYKRLSKIYNIHKEHSESFQAELLDDLAMPIISNDAYENLITELDSYKIILEEKNSLILNLQSKLQKKSDKLSNFIIETSESQNSEKTVFLELKSLSERYKVSEINSSNTISSLESKILNLSNELNHLKISYSTEKETLLDHMIMLERENTSQILR